MNPRTLVVLGVAPVRIDLLTSIDGVPSFAAAWKRRARASFGATETQYLALEDLITAKSASGRPQDEADLVFLRRMLSKRKR
jgi:hypothetical protein